MNKKPRRANQINFLRERRMRAQTRIGFSRRELIEKLNERYPFLAPRFESCHGILDDIAGEVHTAKGVNQKEGLKLNSLLRQANERLLETETNLYAGKPFSSPAMDILGRENALEIILKEVLLIKGKSRGK